MRHMKRKAFTLTELSIAMLIMTTMAATIALSTNAAKQTAKNEAERIAAVITRLIETADRTHSRFWFIPEDNNIYISRAESYNKNRTPKEKTDFKITPGCSFSSSPEIMGYNTLDSQVPHANIKTSETPAVRVVVSSETKSDEKIKFTLTVKGADNSTCYIYVFAEGNN